MSHGFVERVPNPKGASITLAFSSCVVSSLRRAALERLPDFHADWLSHGFRQQLEENCLLRDFPFSGQRVDQAFMDTSALSQAS